MRKVATLLATMLVFGLASDVASGSALTSGSQVAKAAKLKKTRTKKQRTATVKRTAANTGVARCPALTRTSGRTITRDGTLLKNLDVAGEIIVLASHVRLRCVRIRSAGLRGVFFSDGTHNVMDRVEVDCRSTAANDGGVAGSNYTLRRVNIHHCEDGAKVGENVVIEDSYIHDMNTRAPDPHYDGLQIMGCQCFADGIQRNVVIRRNNIETRPPTPTGTSSGATSAILVKSDFGSINGVTIQSNRLSCGTYTIYSVDAHNGYGAPANVRVLNNRFSSCYEFGLSSFDGSVTRKGNVDEHTGQGVL